jgi:hypothetical protein
MRVGVADTMQLVETGGRFLTGCAFRWFQWFPLDRYTLEWQGCQLNQDALKWLYHEERLPAAPPSISKTLLWQALSHEPDGYAIWWATR